MAHNAFKHAKQRKLPITKPLPPTSRDAEKCK